MKQPYYALPPRDDDLGHRLALATRCAGELTAHQRYKCTTIVDEITTRAADLVWDNAIASQHDMVNHFGLAFMSLREPRWNRDLLDTRIIHLLRSARPIDHAAASRFVKCIGISAATPALLGTLGSLLQEGGDETRRSAAYAVVGIGVAAGTPDILLGLASMIRERNADLSRVACSAVRSIGPRAATDDIREAIVLQIESGHEPEQVLGALTAGALGKDAGTDRILYALLALTHSQSLFCRLAALSALGGIGVGAAWYNPVLDRLSKLMAGNGYRERIMAACAVRQMGRQGRSGKVVASLRIMLADDDWKIRRAAQHAVSNIDAVDVLKDALSLHNNDAGDETWMQKELAECVTMLRGGDSMLRGIAAFRVAELDGAPENPVMLSTIEEMLRDRDYATRIDGAHAVEGLGVCAGTDMIVKALTEMLDSDEAETVQAAARAIGAIGARAGTYKSVERLLVGGPVCEAKLGALNSLALDGIRWHFRTGPRWLHSAQWLSEHGDEAALAGE